MLGASVSLIHQELRTGSVVFAGCTPLPLGGGICRAPLTRPSAHGKYGRRSGGGSASPPRPRSIRICDALASSSADALASTSEKRGKSRICHSSSLSLSLTLLGI